MLVSIMTRIKVEVDKDGLGYDFCLICLQSVNFSNEKEINSLNFLFNYFKIKEKEKLTVCDKCGENLVKLEKLCNILEKVRLEMDYLFDGIQTAISISNNDFHPASVGYNAIRKFVMEKCGEKIFYPKLKVTLQMLDVSTLGKAGGQSPTSDNWSSDFDSDSTSDSITFNSEQWHENTAIPFIDEIKVFKSEASLQNSPEISNWKRNLTRPKQRIECSKCSKTFSSEQTFKRHDDGVHRRKSYKCTTCSKEFNSGVGLRAHIREVHLRIKPYKCDMCDKSFTRLGELRRHKVTPHIQKPKMPNSKMFVCKSCEKSFANLKALKFHTRRVHTEKRYSCNLCGKLFAASACLKRHVSAVHEMKREHCQAPGCDKSYSHQTKLADHYRLIHPSLNLHENRPTRIRLEYFVKLENGKSVFECKLCKSKFKTVSAVRSHIYRLHAPKTFLCAECGFTTVCNSDLRIHIKHKHKSGMLEKGDNKNVTKTS